VIRSSTAKPHQETANINLNQKEGISVIIYLPETTLMPFILASVRVLFATGFNT